MVGVKGKSGRKIKYHDLYHKLVREHQRIYTEKNREAWNLGMRKGISLAEARKQLKEEKQKKG